MVGQGSNAADLMVIFGITGDLARTMTLRALYRLECRKLLDCPILGVASRQRSDGELIGCCTPRSPATTSCSPARTASRKPGASCKRC